MENRDGKYKYKYLKYKNKYLNLQNIINGGGKKNKSGEKHVKHYTDAKASFPLSQKSDTKELIAHSTFKHTGDDSEILHSSAILDLSIGKSNTLLSTPIISDKNMVDEMVSDENISPNNAINKSLFDTGMVEDTDPSEKMPVNYTTTMTPESINYGEKETFVIPELSGFDETDSSNILIEDEQPIINIKSHASAVASRPTVPIDIIRERLTASKDLNKNKVCELLNNTYISTICNHSGFKGVFKIIDRGKGCLLELYTDVYNPNLNEILVGHITIHPGKSISRSKSVHYVSEYLYKKHIVINVFEDKAGKFLNMEDNGDFAKLKNYYNKTRFYAGLGEKIETVVSTIIQYITAEPGVFF
jgi:hypothetical protein